MLHAGACGGAGADGTPTVDADVTKDVDAHAAVDGEDAADGAAGEVVGPGLPCAIAADCGAAPSACHGWVCHPTLGCVATLLPDDALCVPSDACAIEGRCEATICVVAKAKDCDDGVPCTKDACVEGACGNSPIAAAANVPCDDGDACTFGDHCDGACTGGVNQCLCATDADCAGKTGGDLCAGKYYCALQKDGSRACQLNPATVVLCANDADTACRTNVCDPKIGACKLIDTKDGGPCQDGDACTDGEVCQAGACVGGTQVCCQDDAGCKAKDDGDLCNGTYFCNKAKGLCQFNPATVVSCPSVDDTACSQNTCDPKGGKCGAKAVADGTPCDDGNTCTPGQEVCAAGACKAAANTCQCSSDADCAGKDDGNLCNGTMYCAPATGTCAPNPATVVLCPTVDDTACTKKLCQAKSGTCAMAAVADGLQCDADGSPCTPTDTCKAGACVADAVNTCTCQTTADCAKYDDGDLCNGSLYCDVTSQVCQLNPATVVSCPSAGNTACAKNLCVAATGQCALTFVHQSQVCDDGDPCSKGDVCDNGTCKPGADVCLCHQDADCAAKEDGDLCNGTLHCRKDAVPWTCDVKPSSVISCPSVNDNACQKSLCQPKTGLCLITPIAIDQPCDDGDPCTFATVCKGTLCINPDQNATKPCDDGNACTDDSCDPKIGCLNAANKAPCSDGDACSDGDTCAGKGCVPGKAKVCDDGNACTTDVCNKVNGCVVFYNGDPCSDGNACTAGEVCAGGACQAGVAKECTDNKPCTLDGCDAKTGQCTFDTKIAAAVLCDDKVACTVDTCDPTLGCKHIATESLCGDGVACTVDACSVVLGCTHQASDGACEDGSACTLDRCITGKGCVADAAPAGTGCFDADPCTFGDTCQGTTCAPGPKFPACNVDPKQCQGQADGKACNDGDACSKDDACLGGVCAAKVVEVAVSTFLAQAPTALNENGYRLQATTRRVDSIAHGPDGSIYFASETMVRRIDLQGQVRTLLGNGQGVNQPGVGTGATFALAVGLLVEADGGMWILDNAAHRLMYATPGGAVSVAAGSTYGNADGPALSAKFYNPHGLTKHPDGRILIADTANHCLRVYDPKAKTVAPFSGACGSGGFVSGSADKARYAKPSDIKPLPGGAGFVVADMLNHSLRKIAPDGSVTTIAGNGSSGWIDGKGAAARFSQPYQLAVAPTSEIFVTELGNHIVRRVLLDGTVTLLAGSGKAGTANGAAAAAKFYSPGGIAIDAMGDVLVGQISEPRIARISLRRHGCDDGKACTIDTCDAKSGSCGVAPTKPCDDARPCTEDACDDASGVCDWTYVTAGTPCDDGDPCTTGDLCGNGRCYAASAAKTASGPAAKVDGPQGTYGVYNPARLRAARDGGVWVPDYGHHLIRKIAPDGAMHTVAGSVGESGGHRDGPAAVALFQHPSGVVERADGSVVIGEWGGKRLRVLGGDGVVSTLAGTGEYAFADGPQGIGKVRGIADVVLDASGQIVAVEPDSHALRRVASDGTLTTWIGGAVGWVDGPAAVARFAYPEGAALAPDGAIFVADRANHVLRRIGPDGAVTTVAGRYASSQGDGPFAGSGMVEPRSVAVDASGAVYVGQSYYLRRWTASTGLTTIAGNGKNVFAGGLGVESGLDIVTGVAVVGAELWLATFYDHRIVRMPLPGPTCDDDKACTVDACVPRKGCSHIAASAPCDDGDPCTVGDVCSNGACGAGAVASGCPCKKAAGFGCDDGNPCTDEACDPKTGCAWSKRADAAPCEDGNPCTAASACLAGACQPSSPVGATRPFASNAGADNWGSLDGQRLAVGGEVRFARTYHPSGIARADDGTVFLVERDSHSLRRIGSDGTMTTLVGIVPEQGSTYADGPGLQARLRNPFDVDVDGQGGVVIADRDNHAIRRWSADGVLSTLAGAPPPKAEYGYVNGKGAAARFSHPQGVAREAGGTYAVADTSNHVVRRVAADGAVTTLAGVGSSGHVDGPAAAARFFYPVGVAAASDGRIFVADLNNHAVRRLHQGLVTTLAGTYNLAVAASGPGPLGGSLGSPARLAWDEARGRLYVTDFVRHQLRVWQQDFGLRTVAGTGAAGWPYGLGKDAAFHVPSDVAVLPDGRLLVVELENARVTEVRVVEASCDDGNACTVDVCDKLKGCLHAPGDPAALCGDGGPCQQATCDVAVGSCAYAPRPDGTLCGPAGTCDRQCLRGYCRAGALLSAWAGTGTGGDADGPAAKATFRSPAGLASDGAGGVVVSDGDGHRIRRVAADGNVSTLAGTGYGYADGPAAAAKFNYPLGLARTSAGAYVIADRSNRRLRKLSADNKVITIAGSGVQGGADGPGLLATFVTPHSVCIASNGDVYLSDDGSHTVRRLDGDGQVTTFVGSHGSWGFRDGKGAAAKLTSPAGIAFDAKGTLWVADAGGNGLRRVQPDGTTELVFGVTAAGAAKTGEGRGRHGPGFHHPFGVLPLGDGSLLVTDHSTSGLRRVWPGDRVETIVGIATAAKPFAEGFGHEGALSGAVGMALLSDGGVIVADAKSSRLARVDLQLTTCKALAGASQSSPAASCAALAKDKGYAKLGHAWIAPGGGKPLLTVCDDSTAGGGWTRFDVSWKASEVNALLGNAAGGKGQVMRKCDAASANAVVSPATDKPWSWTTKTAIAGSWSANGVAVSCGADASFDDLPCGAGYGCASDGADKTKLLPGMSAADACATPDQTWASGKLAVCGTAAKSMVLYGRAVDSN